MVATKSNSIGRQWHIFDVSRVPYTGNQLGDDEAAVTSKYLTLSINNAERLGPYVTLMYDAETRTIGLTPGSANRLEDYQLERRGSVTADAVYIGKLVKSFGLTQLKGTRKVRASWEGDVFLIHLAEDT